MEIPEHRRWMYNRIDPQTRNVRSDFIWGVESFISAAYQLDDFKDDEKIRCPCCICQCVRRKPPDVVRRHLYNKGFQPNYHYWHNHGENRPSMVSRTVNADSDGLDNYEQMVMDAGGDSFFNNHESEEPNATYKDFYDCLTAAQCPLWEGCEDQRPYMDNSRSEKRKLYCKVERWMILHSFMKQPEERIDKVEHMVLVPL